MLNGVFVDGKVSVTNERVLCSAIRCVTGQSMAGHLGHTRTPNQAVETLVLNLHLVNLGI